MSNKISQLFSDATFEPERVVGGVYHPYIPLQIYGEEMRLSITPSQYQAFGKAIVEECLNILIQHGSYEAGAVSSFNEIAKLFEIEADYDERYSVNG